MDKSTAVIVAALVGAGVGFGIGYLVVSYVARQRIKGSVASGLSAVGLSPSSSIGNFVNQLAGQLIDAN